MSAKRAGGPLLSGSSDEEDEEKGRCRRRDASPEAETAHLDAAEVVDEGAEVAPYVATSQLKAQRPALLNNTTTTPDTGSIFSMEDSIKFRRPKQKKKKPAPGFPPTEEFLHTQPAPPKTPKQKRDYLPMRMRALPQSFWQQPNHPHNISPGTLCHRLLPPLCLKDSGLDDDIDTVRPVSPQADKETRERDKIRPPRSEPKMTIVNPDLLHKLFEQVEDKRQVNAGNVPLAPVHAHSRRGRPKRILSSSKTQLMGGDPHLVETVTSKLFPHLSIDAGRSTSSGTAAIGAPNVSVQLITIHEGDKCVTLPSLCVEQNYSQMLSELASHI